MDYDRKSTVSSFYGDRRAPVPAVDPRARRDSSSSFFNPNAAALPPGARHSAAMAPTHGSYADAGADEGDAWDIYADFNNAGPKYSSAFGMRGNEASYHPLHDPHSTPGTPGGGKFGGPPETADPATPVELVTVPALGAEWKTSELRDMTSRGRRERNAEKRGAFWRDFSRGQRGLFGRKWLSKRFIVFFCFGLIIAIGVVLAFTIPRVPAFLFNADTPLESASGFWNASVPTLFSVSPTNFSFPAVVNLQVNPSDNFLPLTFTRLDGTVYDLTSLRTIATGHINRTTVPAKKFSPLSMPLNFTYSAVNSSDATWSSWHKACENTAIAVNGTRPSVQFRLVIEMGIAGLPGSHSTSTTVTNAACPIELPINAS